MKKLFRSRFGFTTSGLLFPLGVLILMLTAGILGTGLIKERQNVEERATCVSSCPAGAICQIAKPTGPGGIQITPKATVACPRIDFVGKTCDCLGNDISCYTPCGTPTPGVTGFVAEYGHCSCKQISTGPTSTPTLTVTPTPTPRSCSSGAFSGVCCPADRCIDTQDHGGGNCNQ